MKKMTFEDLSILHPSHASAWVNTWRDWHRNEPDPSSEESYDDSRPWEWVFGPDPILFEDVDGYLVAGREAVWGFAEVRYWFNPISSLWLDALHGPLIPLPDPVWRWVEESDV